jgi:hypothetical protein
MRNRLLHNVLEKSEERTFSMFLPAGSSYRTRTWPVSDPIATDTIDDA